MNGAYERKNVINEKIVEFELELVVEKTKREEGNHIENERKRELCWYKKFKKLHGEIDARESTIKK